jgi:hypothetical protein
MRPRPVAGALVASHVYPPLGSFRPPYSFGRSGHGPLDRVLVDLEEHPHRATPDELGVLFELQRQSGMLRIQESQVAAQRWALDEDRDRFVDAYLARHEAKDLKGYESEASDED